MKRGLLGFPLLILLTQVVSAQFFSGYGRFSITDLFYNIDPATITLGLLFLIFFALIFYALSKIFKDPSGQPNKGIAGTIAFAVSFLIIYGIHRSGFDLESLFYGFGIDTGTFYLIASIIILIGAIFLIKKIKITRFLIVLGLFLILLVIFTDIFYEETFIVVIGLILFLVGCILLWRKRKRKLIKGDDYGRSPPPYPDDYGKRARELRDKQRYQYYKELEEQQRRARARELKRKEARERKLKERYIRRFSKRAWKKREKEGRNF